MSKQIMLIVDDAQINRELLADCFQGEYDIIYACNGREATEKIREFSGSIAIILLDIIMPEMDGIAVLKWMSDKTYRSIPVIAVTADDRYQLEALRAGAWDFIPKSSQREVIRARVKNVLSRYALTDERKFWAMLVKEKRKMDNIVNSIPGGIATYRMVNGRFETVFFSDGVAALSGRSRDEYVQWVGNDATVTIYEQDKKRLLDVMVQALEKGEAVDETFRIYHKDGSLVWVHLTGMVVGNENGVPLVHTIFQRPGHMAQLYDKLVNESNNIIYVSDLKNYDLLYINDTGLSALGKTRPDYTGKKCYETVFNRTAPCPFCRISEMNKDTFLKRDIACGHTGRQYALRGKLTDWNGIPAHVEYARDITEQRLAEEKNVQLIEQLQSVTNNIPNGICVYRADKNGIRPVTHNQTLMEVFGFSPEHQRVILEEGRFMFGVHPDDVEALSRDVLAAVENNQPLDRTYRSFNDEKNEYIWVNMKSVVVPQSGGEKICYVSYTDVTAERCAQEQLVLTQQKLQENQLRYETAVKSAGINIWEYDVQRDSLYVVSNSARTKQNCYRIDHYVDATLEGDYIRQDSIPRFKKLFERLRQGESPITEDLWYKTTDQAGWWCERATYTTTFDAAGKPITAFGAGRDVTAEKIAEQKFREELAYRRAMQHENTASVMIDLTENLVVEVDSSFRVMRQLLGATADEYFIRTVELLTGDKHKEQFQKMFGRKQLLSDFNRGEYSRTMETTRLYDTGKVFWVRYTVHLIQNPDTRHVMAHITGTDTTSERVMQTIMETVSSTEYEGFTVVDGSTDSGKDYGVLAQTRHFDEHVSYEAQNEAWIRASVCPEDVERVIAECKIDAAWERVKDGIPYKFSFNMRRPDGTIRHKQTQLAKISATRRTYLISLMDVNNIYEEQEAAKRNLQRALQDAEQANRVKTEFLSRMSHDIRTPMNAILSLSALGQDSGKVAETKDYLRKIEASGQYLLGVINEVLNLSKMENRGIVLQPKVVFLPTFVENTVAIVLPTAQEKNVELKVKQIGISDQYVRLDTTYVRQVVINLLSNAIKFTPSGGRVELKLETICRQGKFVKNRITVRDTGIGISPEFLPRVFVPFEQENNQNDLSRQGTGLGLSIVKEIVQQMNGKIWVKSEKGKGSEFFVEWTFETASAAEMTEEMQLEQIVDLASLRGKRLLLAEDHPLNAQIAARLLEKKGMVTEHAENGQVAVEFFSRAKPGYYDAVLMDIRMPVMNGLQAASAIRALSRADAKTIPIIAMTANAFEDDVRASLDAGMNAHLAKPIDPQKLYATLAALTDKTGKA